LDANIASTATIVMGDAAAGWLATTVAVPVVRRASSC